MTQGITRYLDTKRFAALEAVASAVRARKADIAQRREMDVVAERVGNQHMSNEERALLEFADELLALYSQVIDSATAMAQVVRTKPGTPISSDLLSRARIPTPHLEPGQSAVLPEPTREMVDLANTALNGNVEVLLEIQHGFTLLSEQGTLWVEGRLPNVAPATPPFRTWVEAMAGFEDLRLPASSTVSEPASPAALAQHTGDHEVGGLN